MDHDRVGRVVVRLQHRGSPPEQVPADQLRVQVPDFPDPLPHDGVQSAQLRGHSVYEGGSYAEREVQDSVGEDRGAQCRFLFLGGVRERVVEVPSGVV